MSFFHSFSLDNVPVEAGLELEAVTDQVDEASSQESSVAADAECHSLSSTSQNTQTELTVSQINDLQEQYNLLVAKKVALERKQQKINEEYFLGDDERVRFYTGLESYSHITRLYTFIEKNIHVNCNSALTGFQQMILTLMRLRLNLPVQDLAYRFDVSPATVSKIFLKILDVLHANLNWLIKWPSRDVLRKTMPICFRDVYGTKVAVIIDCFEVFLDRPSNLMAQAQTWSSYKHHNTVKFLIGIAPHGCVSFISKGWGGRTSDKYITEHCGFFSNIIPGDVILADRGFDIAESVSLMQASLEVPTFMGGKKQLSGVDVLKTRNIANVRIHVERVIGLVRQKYKILGGPLPVDYAMKVDNNEMSTIDKIATVCCALTNLCRPLVSVD